MRIIFTMLLVLATIFPVSAQHDIQVIDVVPGSKGPLPEKPQLPQLQGNRVAGLLLKKVSFYNGGWGFQRYEAELYLPTFTAEEAEYCTLQYRTKSSGEWYNTSENFKSGADITPTIVEDTDYRVVLHNGTKDGYISNEVSAVYPKIHYSFITSSQWFYADPLFVGDQITGSRVWCDRRIRTWDKDKQYYVFSVEEDCGTQNTNYYRRQWCRMNPNTYEIEPIEGATGQNYVTTEKDLGYNIMEIIKGDDIHISYYIMMGHENVKTCILASLEYIGSDGFIINTDYVLPDGGKDLRIIGYEGEVARDKIKELKPGQYAVYAPVNENVYYMGAYQTDDIWDNEGDFILRFDRGQPEQRWLRPVQIYGMMYNMPIVINASVNTPIDIVGRNIDNQWGVVANYDISQVGEGDYFRILYGKYYLKARGTSTTLPTYYPNKLIWCEATPASPGEEYDEQYNPIVNTYNIQAVAKPAPLTGSGVVSGTIGLRANARAEAGPYLVSAQSLAGQMVYLRKSDGNVAAYTETDAAGNFSFQNVPQGTYTVLVNIEGIVLKQPAQVTLTAANPNALDVKYVIDGNVIRPANAGPEGDVNADNVVDVADIAFVIDVMAKGAGSGGYPQADVNGDGVIDVADIASVIDIMAGK